MSEFWKGFATCIGVILGIFWLIVMIGLQVSNYRMWKHERKQEKRMAEIAAEEEEEDGDDV